MPAGRPNKEIDKGQFEKLCALHPTLIEIAGFFSCSEDTIERWCERVYGRKFADVFREKKGQGKLSLRRKQFETAMKGDKTMLIWLGKNLLDQKDKTELSSSADRPFQLAYNINKSD